MGAIMSCRKYSNRLWTYISLLILVLLVLGFILAYNYFDPFEFVIDWVGKILFTLFLVGGFLLLSYATWVYITSPKRTIEDLRVLSRILFLIILILIVTVLNTGEGFKNLFSYLT